MITDPLTSLKGEVQKILTRDEGGPIRHDYILGPDVPWRPHLYGEADERGWYLLSAPPREDIWTDIIRRARQVRPALKLGVCAPLEALRDANTLRAIDAFDAEVLPFEHSGDAYIFHPIYPSIAEVIIERGWILDHQLASMLFISLAFQAAR